MKHIAIFASGTGTNARKIIEHFAGHTDIKVSLIISNKPTAPVLDIAKEFDIATCVINRQDFYQTEDILKKIHVYSIDFVVLAGFLWLIPLYWVKSFKHQIVNIHPALLPKYGGKGMYGMNVHKAVQQANEKESGITIHFVNERYDEGDIIFQAKCNLSSNDEVEDIAQKVRKLEHQHFARVIEEVINSKE
jgi:phosphoribosylglycinamide formyltransferase-1